jgi:hypothetical protein
MSNTITNKPFCKVCQDAGKSEAEYTSHYVRTFQGKNAVICPTLLATECRYCCGIGHTTKYCPTLIKNKKAEEKASKYVEIKAPVTSKEVTTTVFSMLDLSDDEEEEAEPFPSLGKVSEKNPVITGWAAIVGRPSPLNLQIDIPVLRRTVAIHPEVRRNWADWSDSDDEATVIDDDETAVDDDFELEL